MTFIRSLRLACVLIGLVPFIGAQTYTTSTVAGAAGSSGSADGMGASARFRTPTSLGRDGAGNLYAMDAAGTVLRKITPSGLVTTILDSVGGQQTIAVAASGVVYLSDSANHVIRRMATDGALTVLAGTAGVAGNANGTGSAARFNSPQGLAVDAAGTVYVCDTANYVIRKITPAGVVSTVAGLAGIYGTTDGPAPLARFSNPVGIAVDGTGNLYVADRSNYAVRKITPAGDVSTLAGGSYYYSYGGTYDGTGTAAHFGSINALCVDQDGTLFVTEETNAVRRVTGAGVVTTVLGLVNVSGIAEGVGLDARFSRPNGIAVDPTGNLFIVDTANQTVRKAMLIPLPAIGTQPAPVAADAGTSATFSVVSAGGPTAVYQWQRQAAGSGTFVNLTEGGAYAGTTTSALVVSGLTAVMNGDQFRCVVTNAASTAFSAPATLTVLSAPVFVSVATATFPVGQASAFAVTAVGSPSATYGIAAGSFPSWASLNSSTGVITGTPPDASGSPFSFTLSAANGRGTTNQSFTLSVPAPATMPSVAILNSRRQAVPKGQSLFLSANASGTGPLAFQWKRNGLPILGATTSGFTITNASASDVGYYQLVVSNAAGSVTATAIFVGVTYPATEVLAWATTLAPPAGLMNVTAVAAGYSHGVALRTDGTVQAWGSDSTITTIPSGLNEVVAIAAAGAHSLALKSDGTVVAWGSNYYGETSVPGGLTDVVAIAAGERHSIALKGNGTVVEWGTSAYSTVTGYGVPAGLSGVVGIAGGDGTSLAVKSDGSVVVWGYSSSNLASVPARALPAAQIAVSGSGAAISLRRDGSIATWGYSSSTVLLNMPAGLTGVAAVASSASQGIALKTDGSIVTWGDTVTDTSLLTLPANLRSVVAIAGGAYYRLALRNASSDAAPVITASPGSALANLGQSVTFTAAASAGTASYNWQWYKNSQAIAGATNSTYTVSGVDSSSAGFYFAKATNSLGTATTGTATLSISAAPVVSVATGGRYPISLGQSLTLSLSSTISGSATVQWKRNGQTIAGATGRSFAIVNATSAQGGYYQAVYDEGAGAVTSAAIFVPFVPVATQSLRYDLTGVESAGFSSNVVYTALSSRGSNLMALDSTGLVWRTSALPSSYSYYYDDPAYVPAGVSGAVAVAAGYSFSMALKADGTVVAWGTNSSVTATSAPAMAVPAGLTNVVGISAGTNHALALRGDGTVVAWGAPNNGATAVPAGLNSVVAVAAGDAFSLALRADGTVIGWGRNSSGESAPPAGLSGVVAIAAGSYFGLALKFDGTVVAWGSTNAVVTTIPAGLAGVTAIAAGDTHAVALKSDGAVVTWGSNSNYYSSNPAPVLPATLRNVIAVAAGTNSSAVLRDAAADTLPVITTDVVDVVALTGQNITLRVGAAAGTAPLTYRWSKSGAAISGATDATLVLVGATAAQAGSYQVLVSNYLGYTYSRTATVTVSPTIAASVTPAGRSVVAAGGSLTLTGSTPLTGAVTYQWRRNGRLVPGATSASLPITGARWSDGGAYQLVATNAVGPAVSAPVFVVVSGPFVVRGWGSDNSSGQISVPAGLTGAVAVAAGYNHSLALKDDGTVVSWGNASYGLQNVPAGLSNVVAIAAGNQFSLALRANGTVASWGGINFTPIDLTNVIAIAASSYSGYALALRGDGTVVAWTADGVRGDTPTNIGDVVAIASGGYYRYALRSDGSVVQWSQGDSYYGTAATLSTVATSGVAAISAGSDYLLMLRSDGTLLRVTTSSYPNVSVPAGITNVTAISAGPNFAYALGQDGTVIPVTTSSGYDSAAASVSPSIAVAVGYSHTLVLRDPRGDAAPVITAQTNATTVAYGGTVTLSVTVTGVPTPIYQWYRNGLVLSGATASTLTLNNVTDSYDGGSYTVTISNAMGSVTSAPMVLTVSPTSGQRSLLRVSARANALPALLMSSFTLEGGSGKLVLVRGVGPTLASFGLADTLSDPAIAVTTSTGSAFASNDNWQNSSTITNVSYNVGAFPLVSGSRDAALVQNFPSGTYHARLTGPAGGGGLAWLELFDADSTGSPRLVYVATQAFTGAGNDTFVEGINLTNLPSGRSYLIRALGPSLTGPGTLADPKLAIYNVDGAQVAANDDWAGDTALASLGAGVGAMPLSATSKDAVLNFAPTTGGTYTLKVSGPPGTSGRVLLEIFEIDATRAATTPAAIVAPPVAVVVLSGQPVAFGVVTIGKPAPTFQWRKNGTTIPNATDATYTIPAAQAADVADYSVVATNAVGTATSTAASLSLVGQTATHAIVGPGYVAGSTVTLTNTLTYVGTATSVGWELVLPPGWSYASGTGEGDVKPAAGATGTLGWSWTTPPASPVTFTCTLNVPAGQTTVASLAASAIVRSGGTAQTAIVTPGPLLIAAAPTIHSADTNGDSRISLLELTRVIELYNTRNGSSRTGAYSVATAASEDGFVADPTRAAGVSATLTKYHSADSNQDGKISLFELTRVIDIYNTRNGSVRTGQYHAQGSTEDGFGVGP